MIFQYKDPEFVEGNHYLSVIRKRQVHGNCFTIPSNFATQKLSHHPTRSKGQGLRHICTHDGGQEQLIRAASAVAVYNVILRGFVEDPGATVMGLSSSVAITLPSSLVVVR
jgi:hypothetical protein